MDEEQKRSILSEAREHLRQRYIPREVDPENILHFTPPRTREPEPQPTRKSALTDAMIGRMVDALREETIAQLNSHREFTRGVLIELTSEIQRRSDEDVAQLEQDVENLRNEVERLASRLDQLEAEVESIAYDRSDRSAKVSRLGGAA